MLDNPETEINDQRLPVFFNCPVCNETTKLWGSAIRFETLGYRYL